MPSQGKYTGSNPVGSAISGQKGRQRSSFRFGLTPRDLTLRDENSGGRSPPTSSTTRPAGRVARRRPWRRRSRAPWARRAAPSNLVGSANKSRGYGRCHPACEFAAGPPFNLYSSQPSNAARHGSVRRRNLASNLLVLFPPWKVCLGRIRANVSGLFSDRTGKSAAAIGRRGARLQFLTIAI